MLSFENTVENEIGDWINTLNIDTLKIVLEELDLRCDGTSFAGLDRLYRRLRGDYSDLDFIASDPSIDEQVVRSTRDEKLNAFVHKSLWSEHTKAEILVRQHTGHSRRLYNDTNLPSDLAEPIGHSSVQGMSLDMAAGEILEARNPPIPVTTSVPLQQHAVLPASTAQPVIIATTTTATTTVTTTALNVISTTSTATLVCNAHKTIMSNASDPTSTLEQERLKREQEIEKRFERLEGLLINLTKQMLSDKEAQSTRPVLSENARERTKTVHFQDTYDLQYIDPNPIAQSTGYQLPTTNDLQHQPTTQPIAKGPSLPSNLRIPNIMQQPELPPYSRGSESRGRGEPVHSSSLASGSAIPTLNSTQSPRYDVGKTVRAWKVRFSGSKESCIEEFLQRVEECRRLAYISDEDLLNAMTELMTGPALCWCRQLRSSWRTWNDFYEAARRNYGVDRDVQIRLLAEAQARRQGKSEPVRDYIFIVLTILSKMQEQMPVEAQLNMIHRNMLPELRKQVPRERVRNIDDLVTLAREAEQLLNEERNYVPPPTPEQSLLPNLAYKEPEQEKKETKKVGPARQVNLATVCEEKSNLEASIAALLDEKLKNTLSQFSKTDPPKSNSNSSNQSRKKDQPSGQKQSSRPKNNSTPRDNASNATPRARRAPKSDHNKGKSRGPIDGDVYCYKCSWPGYISITCPSALLRRRETRPANSKRGPYCCCQD